MAVLDFLLGHKIQPAVIHCFHGTEHGLDARLHVLKFCEDRKIKTFFGFDISTHFRPKKKRESKEEYWRLFRLDCFAKVGGPVITAHNLDDVCETWIWSSLHGESKLLPHRNGQVIRPFRATPKADLLDWCQRHNVPYLQDPSNSDTRYMRNHIRHKLMPEALHVNPGLRKVILKKVLADAKENL